jgi:hypothetical protein
MHLWTSKSFEQPLQRVCSTRAGTRMFSDLPVPKLAVHHVASLRSVHSRCVLQAHSYRYLWQRYTRTCCRLPCGSLVRCWRGCSGVLLCTTIYQYCAILATTISNASSSSTTQQAMTSDGIRERISAKSWPNLPERYDLLVPQQQQVPEQRSRRVDCTTLLWSLSLHRQAHCTAPGGSVTSWCRYARKSHCCA